EFRISSAARASVARSPNCSKCGSHSEVYISRERAMARGSTSCLARRVPKYDTFSKNEAKSPSQKNVQPGAMVRRLRAANGRGSKPNSCATRSRHCSVMWANLGSKPRATCTINSRELGLKGTTGYIYHPRGKRAGGGPRRNVLKGNVG